MLNFDFHSPTRVVFGKDTEYQVGELSRQFGQRVLVHYGSGSVVRSGLLARVTESLKKSGLKVIELGGVQPNPRDTLIYEGIRLAKAEAVDFILAVGGGSVIDSAKGIAAGVLYDGDFWDLYNCIELKNALPVGVVLTIPAAGSEGSVGSVVTREDGLLKRDCISQLLRPRFAILNPELTFTIPSFHTACGCCDIMAHVLERYMTNERGGDFTDRLCEAVLSTIVWNAPTVLAKPDDYDARANIMFAGMIAHNDLVGCGREGDWSCHQMEHELSGLYDVIHGAGLAVMLPAFMRYQYQHDIQRFARMAVNVFGIEMDYERPEVTAIRGIDALEAFFRSIGLPTTFQELGAREEDIDLLTEKCKFNNGDLLGYFRPLTREQVKEVYRMACR
jgi:alcohol dehydrogenase YqhD (iron-dependent ADH family)